MGEAQKAHEADPGTPDEEKTIKAVADDDSDDVDVYDGQRKLREIAAENQQFPGIKREHWWQIWRPRHAPPPPKATLDDAEVIPLAYVSIFSILTFQWVTPIMMKGYQRPLQATDLWKMDPSREADYLSTKFLNNLATCRRPAVMKLIWMFIAMKKLPEQYAPYGPGRTFRERYRTIKAYNQKHISVAFALDQTMVGFWSGGWFKVFGDTGQLMSPLVVKALITYSQEVYAATQNGTPVPSIGRGVGMALGLWGLTIFQSICQHQFFFRSMHIGVLARATLIAAVYKRALVLSPQSRTIHPNGKLVNHVSSDISRIDYCAQWFHAIWTAPIQLCVCLTLLLVQIGPSALVGFSMFVLLGPLQTWFMKKAYTIRKNSMQFTDGRAKLLRELLASMQIIKVFTYEIPFLKRLKWIRRKEMTAIRKILIIRAANQAMAFSVPTIAAVLAFVTYASTHADFNPAIIFTSLALFNLLRQPLMFLPRALSTLTDAQNAIDRLTEVFEAETMDVKINIDPSLDVALRVDAHFNWSETQDTRPFNLAIKMDIERGKLIAIAGPVGSGKSSLLQGLIGEMNTEGSVVFGGKIAYCQQNAWIQNATLRDNVVFGQAWDEHRYWSAIKAASLVSDLEILPDGDLTEIGEKGVNLSGGQKQRVNIARALYFDADVILFDDPLSAVDAHVGKFLFENAIMGLRARGKTVLLVTHAIHFLPAVDYIYTLQHGAVVEQGTYSELITRDGPLAHLVAEFGSDQASQKENDDHHEVTPVNAVRLTKKHMGKAAGTGRLEGRLMVSEIRKTGSVGRKVYAAYLRAGRAKWTGPLTLIFAAIMQTSQVMSTVWLTYWEGDKFARPLGFYEGIYACLGVSQAIFTFAMGATMSMLSFLASNNLHSEAITNIFYSPMSMFDTLPLGRILGVFGKDVDMIDNQLADSFRMMALTLISLLGSVIIITVYFHYFIAVIICVGIGYGYFSMFYRTSAREVKRLDSLLRGLLYAHFSESLSGLATIRAYGESTRFVKENGYYMDLEDRAYLLTTTNQRWLSVRLDFLGGCLVFAVAVMAAKGGGGLQPSEIALCLTYMTQIVQIFGMVTRQAAEVENNMNAVERVLWYANKESLPQEAAYDDGEIAVSASWPEKGEIKFENVELRYRPGLPTVLKGISLAIQSGEKVGVAGKTGAGKSSLTVALYRLTELCAGKISIDGVDLSKLGLKTLRSRISIIPQEPVLFSGTLRTNLDPFDLYPDDVLYDAMRRACIATERFSLDTVIEDEGGNLSVGERSLVSLARALVKDSRIVVLDEATASVDLETDSKIQQTIHREFEGKTLFCIAHRLRTIISWDKILIMSAGEVHQFAPPLELYDQEGGIFRGMCDQSGITRDDIVQSRQGREKS